MRELIIWILFLWSVSAFLASCTTTNKALNKIASSGKLNDSQDKLLATICSTRYPPLEFISEGTTVTDSTRYKQAIASLESQLAQYKADISRMSQILIGSGKNNEGLQKVMDELKKRSDSLSIALTLAKLGNIPCPDRIKTDTAHKVSVAELQACQIDNKSLKVDNAQKDVEIASLNEKLKKEQEKSAQLNIDLKNKPDRYWAGFKLGAIIAAGVVLVGGTILKLKSII